MEWTDKGIVLSVRPHGESAAVVTLMSEAYGRHAGLMRGGSSLRHKGMLQPGNSVRAVWQASWRSNSVAILWNWMKVMRRTF